MIEQATGRLFVQELVERIIRPLSLAETAPNPGDPQGFRSLVASLAVSAQDIDRSRAVFAASGIDRVPVEAALARVTSHAGVDTGAARRRVGDAVIAAGRFTF